MKPFKIINGTTQEIFVIFAESIAYMVETNGHVSIYFKGSEKSLTLPTTADKILSFSATASNGTLTI